MPEGPEIRLAADRVAKAVEGRRCSRVFFERDDLQDWAEELSGRIVLEIEKQHRIDEGALSQRQARGDVTS